MEKTTTIRLEINGEPAKNTLEALRQRAEVLSQKISAIKFPAQSGGNESLMCNVYGLTDSQSGEANPLGTSATPPIATQQRESENLTEQQLRDLKRLEQEYAAVTAEIEQQEEALQGVARVMNSIVAENERKEGLVD